MADTDFVELLPRRIRARFEGLNGYVGSVLEEEELNRTLTRESIQAIQLMALIGALDQFFRDGTSAAIAAVDAFADLGTRGFRIGSQAFSARNENVMRGLNLSDNLREAIQDERLLRLLSRELGLRGLIIECARVVVNG
jgi:hypothetical protein